MSLMMVNQWSTMLAWVTPSFYFFYWSICSLFVFCFPTVLCLSPIDPGVVNQLLKLYCAVASVLHTPEVCGLAPFQSPFGCIASRYSKPFKREQLPHTNNLLSKQNVWKKKNNKKKTFTVCWAFSRKTRTQLKGSVHGLCVLVETWNQQPEWRDWGMWWPLSADNAVS